MKSIEILCMVVLGGMGNTYGAILGAGIITVLPEFLRSISPAVSQYRMVFYGMLLVIMMIVRPQGIMGQSDVSVFKVSGIFKRKTVQKGGQE
jgi:branched-chain amino acid transport system permease protein